MHVHTASSPDAELSASALCKIACSVPVGRIGFVAHLDMHPLDFCYGGFDEKRYLKELDNASAAGGPEVLRGLEIGEPHVYWDEASKLFHLKEYDFITGALHWLKNDLVLEESCFDNRNDPLELVEEYYREIRKMVSVADVDILAHMGIFRRGMVRAGLSTDFDETALFPEILREIFTAMLDRGIVLEVNTAGLRRPEKTTYPSPPVIALYRSIGGTAVTLGSDSHRKENAFFGLSAGARLLTEQGFTEAGFFRQRVYSGSPLQC